MQSLWVCPICDEVWWAHRYDDEWAVTGCPVCDEETRR